MKSIREKAEVFSASLKHSSIKQDSWLMEHINPAYCRSIRCTWGTERMSRGPARPLRDDGAVLEATTPVVHKGLTNRKSANEASLKVTINLVEAFQCLFGLFSLQLRENNFNWCAYHSASCVYGYSLVYNATKCCFCCFHRITWQHSSELIWSMDNTLRYPQRRFYFLFYSAVH